MFKIFQKKPAKSDFTFAGNRTHIRTENELSGYWNKQFAAEWLDALENTTNKETLIAQSMITHDLPQKIQRRSLD